MLTDRPKRPVLFLLKEEHMTWTSLPDGSKLLRVSDVLDQPLNSYDRVIVTETGLEGTQGGTFLMGYHVAYWSGKTVVEVTSTNNPDVLDKVVKQIQYQQTSELWEDIEGILTEHYYSLGIKDGSEAIANMHSDLDAGHFASNLEEWGVTAKDLRSTFVHLYIKWLSDGRIFKSPEEFYPHKHPAGSLKRSRLGKSRDQV
jgi:hypothetical protein